MGSADYQKLECQTAFWLFCLKLSSELGGLWRKSIRVELLESSCGDSNALFSYDSFRADSNAFLFLTRFSYNSGLILIRFQCDFYALAILIVFWSDWNVLLIHTILTQLSHGSLKFSFVSDKIMIRIWTRSFGIRSNDFGQFEFRELASGHLEYGQTLFGDLE